jgi:hypothetical protein
VKPYPIRARAGPPPLPSSRSRRHPSRPARSPTPAPAPPTQLASSGHLPSPFCLTARLGSTQGSPAARAAGEHARKPGGAGGWGARKEARRRGRPARRSTSSPPVARESVVGCSSRALLVFPVASRPNPHIRRSPSHVRPPLLSLPLSRRRGVEPPRAGSPWSLPPIGLPSSNPLKP